MVVLQWWYSTYNDCHFYIDVALSIVSPFLMAGKGGPNLAKWNGFGKCSVAVLGPGELIRRGNVYGMTAPSHQAVLRTYIRIFYTSHCHPVHSL